MQKKTINLLLWVIPVCMIGMIVVGLVGIFYYLTHPKPIMNFHKPTPYTMSEDEIAEFKKVETLMASDSTRYCEADFNGDGILDRAYANGLDTEIIFSIGTDKEKKARRMQLGTSGFTCIACADMNQDGKIDLILGDPGDNRIDILYNDGKGNFAFSFTLRKRSDRIGLGHQGTIFIVKDINQDNLPDIIYKSYSDDYYACINRGATEKLSILTPKLK
ncbi:MAG: VCBS repeat-containing protein [bacterium]|nr:VCBS repeat-containing protein [bacterium]